ncbi:membrane protein YczE [Rhodococcoides corynebacterioides]|uniref:membrane protein YczE n=1 Tax=Rhodococcoides corynebacterioides TaxID=53972 RepID=UPI001C9ADFD3|nr:membrane protein [Rhodococcus corynebacterioides]MBY6352134.1 hypothetical protein [Rhodococcus corynebacterioides]
MHISTGSLSTRLALLFVGLFLYGFSMAMMIAGGLGLNPWDVLHQGLAHRTGASFGTITACVGAVVLLLWIPLRQRPGVGTVANILVIAVSVDMTSAWLPDDASLPVRSALLVGGVVLNGVATAMYISAGMGPGPRDGLMTGIVGRTGWSVRVIRTGIEVSVLAVGWLLGGTVGVGTVLYAVAIGPLVQLSVWLMGRPARRSQSAVGSIPAASTPTETP